MHISNLIGQYHQNGGQPTEAVKGVKGVESLTSTVRGMKAGNVFEGTVSSVKGSKVTLALSNGQELSARLDGKVSLQSGQSMFFQVKSNDGQTVSIRPFVVDGESANLTLINALKAAGLTADSKNLSMVNTMMQEQMSIGANSINQMARAALQNPTIDVTTLVQMQKLGITLSPENASQFENYQNDAQTISKELFAFVDSLPETMSEESLPFDTLKEMNSQVLSVVTSGLPEDAFFDNHFEMDTLTGQHVFSQEAVGVETVASEGLEAESVLPQEVNLQTGEEASTLEEGKVSQGIGNEEEGNGVTLELSSLNEHTIKGLLTPFERETLSDLLKEIPGVNKNPVLFTEDGGLNEKATAGDLLKAMEYTLKGEFSFEEEGLVRTFFQSKQFHTLLQDALSQQWLLKPEAVAKENTVKNLYEKLDTQIKQMEDIIKATGQVRSSFAENAADIRNNIQFMNEINQTYTYVQLPLKMTGQNANGELYVYTNKKSLASGEQDLTAFLHLDMDHLGATDVSVRMRNREVSSNFYMENDEAYALVKSHIPELEMRLAKKGYNARITAVNEGNSINFVDNFLKKDQPSAGTLRRYSFDMRA